MVKVLAVWDLRWNVFNVAEGCCERCGCFLTWKTMHMHENVPRSKGGEQSLANCQALCSKCHIGPDGAHADRRLRLK